MKIAVNARFLLADSLEGIGTFTHEIVSRLARDRPDDELLCFFDRPYDSRFATASNVRPFVLRPPARHPFLFLWWFEWSVARALARHRPDVFFSPDGFLSLRAAVPTLLVVHDIAFVRCPEGLDASRRLYYRVMTRAWTRKAARIATVSEFSRREIVQVYGVASERIDVVPNGVNAAFRPLARDEQSAVRGRYSGGADYLLHVGAIHPRKNVVRLLRAFDRFKRNAGRPTKLLLAGRMAWRCHDVLRAHAGMDHRDDVVFLGYVPATELPRLVGSALALVGVSLYEGFGLPLLEAMASAVPVIASRCGAFEETAGGAALFVDPLDADSIGGAMEQVASAPELRRELAERGLERARGFDWDRSAGAVRRALARIAGSCT
jgi:glycosyltransferase involved in cell wall biosynthesis